MGTPYVKATHIPVEIPVVQYTSGLTLREAPLVDALGRAVPVPDRPA
jgi:hypothetical protein